jgi:hypothetical protein
VVDGKDAAEGVLVEVGIVGEADITTMVVLVRMQTKRRRGNNLLWIGRGLTMDSKS